jgi:hypothetical protein
MPRHALWVARHALWVAKPAVSKTEAPGPWHFQMVAIFVSSATLFAIGKTILQSKVHEILSRSEGSSAWKGLLKFINQNWKEAAKINVLLCFMPVPYGSHPYLFSLTEVPFEQFVFFFMLVRHLHPRRTQVCPICTQDPARGVAQSLSSRRE